MFVQSFSHGFGKRTIKGIAYIRYINQRGIHFTTGTHTGNEPLPIFNATSDQKYFGSY